MFVEASAKNGENVERAFEEACRDILGKIRRGVFDDERVRILSTLSYFVCYNKVWELLTSELEFVWVV